MGQTILMWGRVPVRLCRPVIARLLCVLIFAVALSGCRSGSAQVEGYTLGAATTPGTIAAAASSPLGMTGVPSATPTPDAPTSTPTGTPTPSPTPSPTATPQATPTPLPTATPEVTPTSLPAATLASTIDGWIDDTAAHVGVVVALSDGTVLYQREPDQLFEAASLYKLGIMAEIYRQQAAGILSFDDAVTLAPGFFNEGDDVYSYDADVNTQVPIGDALRAMVTLSSNVAGHALLYVAGTANVNAMTANLGLSQTEIRWNATTEPLVPDPDDDDDDTREAPDPEDAPTATPSEEPAAEPTETGLASPAPLTGQRQGRLLGIPRRDLANLPGGTMLPDPSTAYNVTTPADMAHLFELLLAGKVVSPQASQAMLDLLADQGINDRLPAELPSGTRVAHKTGNLDGLVHDAGVIFAPKGPIVVVVMSDEVEDEYGVVDLMRRIAQLAYQQES